MRNNWQGILGSATLAALAWPLAPAAGRPGPEDARLAQAYGYLATELDRYHQSLDVFTDFNSAGNHFPYQSRVSSQGSKDTVPPMDWTWADRTGNGSSVIKARFLSKGDNWGGWIFMNGIRAGHRTISNFDTCLPAGLDLRGASRLSFQAKGEAGGERIEFFTFGSSWETGGVGSRIPCAHGDDTRKLSTGVVTLSKDWKRYDILMPEGAGRHAVVGFGWSANAILNGNRDRTFYLDDIRYDLPRTGEPRFVKSFTCLRPWDPGYGAFDRSQPNAAHAYDNALAIMAFLAMGDTSRAQRIADAFVYAFHNDRFYRTSGSRRIRNVYMAGDVREFPGWHPPGQLPRARIAGVWDPAMAVWQEDPYDAGTVTGNVAWTMLGLLAFHQAAGRRPQESSVYLECASALGRWVVDSCESRAGIPGYTGGYEGRETSPTRHTFKAAEHNIDLFAAFSRLASLARDGNGRSFWLGKAEQARQFVLRMWDPGEGKFWTGTREDGATLNDSICQRPVDVQAWALLSLRPSGAVFDTLERALAYAERTMRIGCGFDFNNLDSADTSKNGIWYEGTAQMAAAYGFAEKRRRLVSPPSAAGHPARIKDILACIESAQLQGGGIPASQPESLDTGFKWKYFRRAHVGATAWYILAKTGRNPFWMGDSREFARD